MQLIYIYDNDVDIAFVLSAWLEQNGYTTKEFSTPGALIASFRYGLPDCIILDNLFGGITATTDLCDLLFKAYTIIRIKYYSALPAR